MTIPADTPEVSPEVSSESSQRPKRRGRLVVWVLLAGLSALMLLAVGIMGLGLERQASYNANIQRIPSAMPTGSRPAAVVTKAQNWLLVGSDTRVLGGTTGKGNDPWRYGEQRSDTLMLVHLTADRKKAYVVSFPRDSWVRIPGHGMQKINAAFSYGGPALLIKTFEGLTGIRIDHYAAIDFAGLEDVIDAVGTIQVTIEESVHDPINQMSWNAGVNTMNGERAMWFVRQRYNLPNGDFDRIRRQQAVLRALAVRASSGGMITNPVKLNRFLEAATKSVSVDDSVSVGLLRSLALSMRDMRASDISFMTVPNDGSAMRGTQSVVLLDAAQAKRLYTAVRQDKVGAYVRTYGDLNRLGSVS